MKVVNFWHHWICMDCETMNHNSRTFCLSCGQNRSKVQITDKKKLDELYLLINGKKPRMRKGIRHE